MWQLRLLVDLVTDHGSSSGVQHRIGNAYSPECAKCVEDCEDTPFHIICECPAVTVSKRLWFGCEKVLPEEIKKFSIRWPLFSGQSSVMHPGQWTGLVYKGISCVFCMKQYLQYMAATPM